MYNIMISNTQNTPLFLNNCGNLLYYKSINLPTHQQLVTEQDSGAITVFMPADGRTSFNIRPLPNNDPTYYARVLFFKSNINNEISAPDYGISISDGFKSYNNNAKLLKIIDYVIVEDASPDKGPSPITKTYNSSKLGIIVNSTCMASRPVNGRYGQFIGNIFDFTTANSIKFFNGVVADNGIVEPMVWTTRIEFLVVDLTNII